MFSQACRSQTFATKTAVRAPQLLPKVVAIVHNRHAVWKTRMTAAAFQHLHDRASARLHEGFLEARAGMAQGKPAVFVDKGLPDYEQFQRLYTGGRSGRGCSPWYMLQADLTGHLPQPDAWVFGPSIIQCFCHIK